MTQPTASSLRLLLFSLFAAIVVLPSASAQTSAIDLTATFVKRGAIIEDLSAVQVGGIVVLCGKTSDRSSAVEASRIAATLGYRRVANLIVVIDDVKADAAIEIIGQRRLELEPGLAGCTFRVDSNRGAIRLTGRVIHDAQGDLAISILSRIVGVKTIQSDLARL